MKKRYLILLIFACTIIAFWIVGRITGSFQYCSSATPSNYPTLKVGERYFISNLIEPERFDFIAYHTNAVDYKGQMWVHRLCGIGGDTVEIRNGVLYVNELNCDQKLSLAHIYKISKIEFDKVKGEIENDRIYENLLDTLQVIFDDKEIMNQKIIAERNIEPKGIPNKDIKSIYSYDWNVDNFGPLIIPADKYFVLGDSRHNALDSRFIGLINKKEFIGTVIGKH